jgi:hypothetical protein
MGKTVKDGFKGANAHRYKQNPLEKAFAVKWQEENSGLGKPRTILDYLMDESNRGEPDPPISKRDWHVANTLVQWLGSPVGEGFLIDILASPEGEYLRQRLAQEVEYRARKEKK